MKKLTIVITLIMAICLVTACGGSGSSKDDNTLEAYLDSHPEDYKDFQKGIAQGMDGIEGIDISTDVKGNDVIIDMEISEMYKSYGINNAGDAKKAFEAANIDENSAEITNLKDAIVKVEDETGITGVSFLYNYTFDGEPVYEMVITKDEVKKK